MKTQHEHEENALLRSENERLRVENLRFREALLNICCPNCGVPKCEENQLVMECSSSRQHVSKAVTSSISCWAPHIASGSNEYQAAVMETVTSAMDELLRVAQLGEPLWVASVDRHNYVLNEEEYFRVFTGPRKEGFQAEATRESAMIYSAASDLVAILMDVEQWANVFSGVVSRATNLQVFSSGQEGTYNEVVQVMNVEFHVASPVVPTRQSYFARYCLQHVDSTWAIVDVSLDHLHPTLFNMCRRRPSGCLIKDMPSGYSKVIWVEHVEVEGGGVHSIYKPLIRAGLAFGAQRWLAILDGYCQRIANGSVPLDVIGFLVGSGRESLLKVAERMVRGYCRGVNASVANTWTTLSGLDNLSDTVKMMTRKNVDDPTIPFGFQLTMVTSFWLPTPPKRVFDFLRDRNTRKEWDMLLNGQDIEEMAHIVTGNEDGNLVTMYQVKDTNQNSKQTIMLQETRKDLTAAYVIYAPIDMVSADTILCGGDPSCIPILPSGFAILPDGPIRGGRPTPHGETGGSLLTLALQVMVDPAPDANISPASVSVANQIICDMVDKIKETLIS
ncbi:hypothetical protein SASPL_116991 [Salvia splendens]|uniref:START domain-containing protein n=2 Tax=Salvia splendens TaxID=180675 RepID=A0A8X8ZX77_SALSN|nr:hypothetical protein SASPL_116991 [Salvia splendens]